jgi:hypothetical protein
MGETDHEGQFYVWDNNNFCQTLADQVALIYCRRTLEKNQIAIRFENGYGVTILPVPLEEEVFEVLVLRFYGKGINDYQVAQYAPVPELNRGDFEEIIDVCKQVARLPISKARTGFTGGAQANMENQNLGRRWGNAH